MISRRIRRALRTIAIEYVAGPIVLLIVLATLACALILERCGVEILP